MTVVIDVLRLGHNNFFVFPVEFMSVTEKEKEKYKEMKYECYREE